VEIQQLCDTSDLVFLQETWLASHELASLSNLDERFYAKGVTAMDSSEGVLRGRPHGGLAILWRKSLRGCSILDMYDSRLMCIEVNNGEKLIKLVNVYLPVDHYENLDMYRYYLSKITSLVDELQSPYIGIFGDFNTNIRSGTKSLFSKELNKLCVDENFIITDLAFCDESSFTFFSAAHSTVSWLDHFLSTVNTHGLVTDVTILYDYMSSDHFPMCVDLNVSKLTNLADSSNIAQTISRVPWQDLSNDDIHKFKAMSEKNLSKVKLDHSLLLCDNVNCNDISHIGITQPLETNP